MGYGTALENLRYKVLGRRAKEIAEEVPSVENDTLVWRQRLVTELEWLVTELAAHDATGPTKQHLQPAGPGG